MTEKKLSFGIDENLAIKLKQKALDERTTQKALLTKWIQEKLENTN